MVDIITDFGLEVAAKRYFGIPSGSVPAEWQQIGVDDLTTAIAATTTTRAAATNKTKKALEAAASRTNQSVTYQVLFGTSEANHEHRAICVYNTSSTADFTGVVVGMDFSANFSYTKQNNHQTRYILTTSFTASTTLHQMEVNQGLQVLADRTFAINGPPAAVTAMGADDFGFGTSYHGGFGVASESVGASQRIAQKFTVPTGGSARIESFILKMASNSSFVATVSVQSDSAGSPSGSVQSGLSLAGFTPSTTVATQGNFATPAALSAGTYWLVVERTSGSGTFDGTVAGTANQVMFYNGSWANSASVENLLCRISFGFNATDTSTVATNKISVALMSGADAPAWTTASPGGYIECKGDFPAGTGTFPWHRNFLTNTSAGTYTGLQGGVSGVGPFNKPAAMGTKTTLRLTFASV